MVAFSSMIATTRKGYAAEAVAFVEQLYVLPPFRRRGLGRSLLACVAGVASDGLEPRRVDKVALVVRRYAGQQLPARQLYARARLCGRRTRRMCVASTGQEIRIDPLTTAAVGRREAAEMYMEQDASVVREALLHHHGAAPLDQSSWRLTSMAPSEFAATNRSLMQRLRTCHDPQYGGDGEDADVIVARAERVLAVYERERTITSLKRRREHGD